MRRLGITFVVVAAVIIGAVVIGGKANPSARRPAPALPAQVLVAPAQTIHALAGHPAAINFWASWCDPCRKEAPGLERLSRQLAGTAHLVGVDWSDDLGGARSFVRHYGWTFPNLRDPNGVVGNRYGIRGLPTTFILDSGGHIVSELQGPQSAADILRALRHAS